MFFSSIKEINRLLSKGMSNIYLKVTIQKNQRSQNFDFVGLKNLQLMQTSLNFKTTCCNLKIRGFGANCVWLLYYFKFKRN